MLNFPNRPHISLSTPSKQSIKQGIKYYKDSNPLVKQLCEMVKNAKPLKM